MNGIRPSASSAGNRTPPDKPKLSQNSSGVSTLAEVHGVALEIEKKSEKIEFWKKKNIILKKNILENKILFLKNLV